MPDYLIQVTTRATDKPTVTERLVRAKNQATALAHVVNDTVAVDRASTDDVVRLTKAGVELETAA
jgi:hypothetical protein